MRNKHKTFRNIKQQQQQHKIITIIMTKYGKFKVTNILRKVQYNYCNLSNGSVGLSENSLIFASIVHLVA